MKKRIFSMLLALCLALSLGTAALAAEEPEPTPEPEYRLVKVVSQGTEYTFTYGQGGYLPTEILRNGAPYVTAAYDENLNFTEYSYAYEFEGQEVADVETYASTYDEAGNCVRVEKDVTYGDGLHSNVITEYTYDEAGNCVREEGTTDYGDGDVSTSVTEHTYDDAGNCVREEYTHTVSDGATSTKVTELTYDEDGRILSETITEDSGESSGTTYTYGENGRTTKTYDNGDMTTTYEDPLLVVSWYIETITAPDGSAITHKDCILSLEDNMGMWIFQAGCACDGEPTLTYDGNGYLVRLTGTGGETVELTYEPVA